MKPTTQNTLDRIGIAVAVLLLLAIFGIFCARIGVYQYKDHCEVVGNSDGDRWRECDL